MCQACDSTGCPGHLPVVRFTRSAYIIRSCCAPQHAPCAALSTPVVASRAPARKYGALLLSQTPATRPPFESLHGPRLFVRRLQEHGSERTLLMRAHFRPRFRISRSTWSASRNNLARSSLMVSSGTAAPALRCLLLRLRRLASCLSSQSARSPDLLASSPCEHRTPGASWPGLSFPGQPAPGVRGSLSTP